MSSVEYRWSPDYGMRPCEISFRTGLDQLTAWRQRFDVCLPIQISFPAWVGRAMVTKVTPTYSYKKLESYVEIRLRPVGAPSRWYRNAEGRRIEFVPIPDPMIKDFISRPTRIHDEISGDLGDCWGRSPLGSVYEHLSKLGALHDRAEKIVSLDTETTLKVPSLWTTADVAGIEKRIFETLTQKRQLVGRCGWPTIQEKKPMKITKKFYITGKHVTEPAAWPNRNVERDPKATLKEAIAAAETMLQQDSTREYVAISQVIRVVRRKPQPVIVETVK